MARFILSLLFLIALSLPVCAQSAAQELAKGDAAWSRDDYKAAETHFAQALRVSKGNPAIDASALHGRGVARLELHKWSAAKDDLTRAIELSPTNAEAFAARGMARKGLGDYDGLLLDAREAARINPPQFTSFEDDAKSTVLFRRMMAVFAGLGGIVLVIGGYALARVLIRLTRAEREANRANG